MQDINIRNTKQLLLPEKYEYKDGTGYDIYPSFHLEGDVILTGYDKFADILKDKGIVIIDGYVGVLWNDFKNAVDKELKNIGISANWINAETCFKSEADIFEMIKPFLGGNDPIFGFRYTGEIVDYFDLEKIKNISLDSGSSLNIIYGCGAFLTDFEGTRVYLDIPKNEIQFRSRAASINNLGFSKPKNPKEMYKQFYFVDWIVLNRHKEKYYKKIDLIVDAQREDEIVFMDGQDFRNGLEKMKNNYFRVRPWFEPGAWGGNFMKDNFKGLEQDVPNLAWSFELIVPENGLIFENNKILLEVSFDFLMFHDSEGILGKKGAERFGSEFPIRIDYLDTMNGGNLSVQCHPRPEYMKKEFGENFTQDETYYIMECSNDAEVYLGLQDGIEKDSFQKVLEESQEKSEAIDITKYVQKHTAHKHELFLIPNGTIHASGSNCLVLEISSTPYIFTFKMYDWMRVDLDGKPRPINIQRGIDNLYFDRKGSRIKDEFISKLSLIETNDNFEMYHQPTHANHFYDVYSYNIKTEVIVSDMKSCHVMVVAEGTEIILETKNGLIQKFHYGETFVIPYSTQGYKLRNQTGKNVKVLRVFLKDI